MDNADQNVEFEKHRISIKDMLEKARKHSIEKKAREAEASERIRESLRKMREAADKKQENIPAE